MLVALAAGGLLLLDEGVPGPAKTLTVKTVADVRGETFSAAIDVRPRPGREVVDAEDAGGR